MTAMRYQAIFIYGKMFKIIRRFNRKKRRRLIVKPLSTNERVLMELLSSKWTLYSKTLKKRRQGSTESPINKEYQ